MTNRTPSSLDPVASNSPIVLGADGSAHNQSAIAWAVTEAERSHRELVAASSSSEYSRPIAMFSANFDTGGYEGSARTVVRKLADRLRTEHPTVKVTTLVTAQDPSGLLIGAAEEASLVVVGKRGLGAFARVVVGSTSIGVAGRASCPTVIVPDPWDQPEAARFPVLVGIDVNKREDATLAFAFERAHELRVPLVALYVWQTHPAVMVTAKDRRAWGEGAEARLRDLISPWHTRFPDVSVDVQQRHDQPAFGILELSHDAQLLVLGRHSASHRAGGFACGSVTRAVLHYSTIPVAVVPEEQSTAVDQTVAAANL